MFRSFPVKIFSDLAALTSFSGITSTTLCCKKERSKTWKFLIVFYFGFLKIFSCTNFSYIFSFLARAVSKIFAMEK